MLPIPRLAWMAGVLDLKGRLMYKNNSQRATHQVVLAVESKEFPVVRELGSLTGTMPEVKKAKPLKEFMRKGCTEHCPDPHFHVYDYEELEMPPSARWTITGAGMVVVLNGVMPFMQVDRGYREAIEIVESKLALVGQGSGQVMLSMQRLKDLGWDLPDTYQAALDARKFKESNA